MPPLRVARQIEPSQDLLSFANHDTAYAVWLAKVEALCSRFLNVELLQLIESACLDPYDDWQQCMRPEKFFADVIVTLCEEEQGADFIDEVIGTEATWGDRQP